MKRAAVRDKRLAGEVQGQTDSRFESSYQQNDRPLPAQSRRFEIRPSQATSYRSLRRIQIRPDNARFDVFRGPEIMSVYDIIDVNGCLVASEDPDSQADLEPAWWGV